MSIKHKTRIVGANNATHQVSSDPWNEDHDFLDDVGDPIPIGVKPQGGAASLAAMLACMGNFASPNAGGIVAGMYYDNAFQATASGTLAGVANRMDMAPFWTSQEMTIDQLGVAVSTSVAGATVKVCIYDADANGWPNNLLYETGALSAAATGYVSEALAFTFAAGKQYWLGVRHSSTATLRTVAVASAMSLGLGSSGSASNYATILRRSVTFANAAPNPWVFNSGELTSNVTPPSVRMRAA